MTLTLINLADASNVVTHLDEVTATAFHWQKYSGVCSETFVSTKNTAAAKAEGGIPGGCASVGYKVTGAEFTYHSQYGPIQF